MAESGAGRHAELNVRPRNIKKHEPAVRNKGALVEHVGEQLRNVDVQGEVTLYLPLSTYFVRPPMCNTPPKQTRMLEKLGK